MFERSDTILFLDDEAIARTVRLSRIWEKPRKFGPVLRPDRPWEGHCAILYGSVLPRLDGGYEMWYQNFSRIERGPRRAMFGYATSADGVNWEKPSLGLVEHAGSRDNNIILVALGTGWLSTLSVIRDDREYREERRYKMLLSTSQEPGGPGLYAAFSPDGIRWKLHPDPVLSSASDRTTLLHDPDGPCPFIAFTRRHGPEMRAEFRGRVVYRSESADFLTWSDPEPMLAPDLDDPWDVQFYGLPAFRYRDLYLGGLKRLWTTPDRIDTELVVSRDTRTWRRTRQAFLENGPGHAWDRQWIALASSPPIEHGRDLWFYYEGRESAHGLDYPFPKGAIGMATLRRDRFAALEAGPEGFLVTRPFAWTGGRLLLNAAVRVGSGYVRAEVLDDEGAPVPGLTYADAVPFAGDQLDWEPAWTGDASLDVVKGRTIGLKVYLAGARLYAIARAT